MNRWLSSAAVTLAAVAMIGVAHPAAAAPPDSVGGSFEVAGICPFTVLVEIEGKAKTIERPDGSWRVFSVQANHHLLGGRAMIPQIDSVVVEMGR